MITRVNYFVNVVATLYCTSSGTIGELTLEQVFGDAAVIHTAHKPRQAALSQQGKDGG